LGEKPPRRLVRIAEEEGFPWKSFYIFCRLYSIL